jgi:alpha-ketoglutarate-dependent taurine dioxygenase
MQDARKPSYDEWMYWTQVIVDRLTTITHVYGNPPHVDVFMAEKERQTKLSDTVAVLRKLHHATDEHELRLPQEFNEAVAHEEQLIAELQILYRDILARLPDWSEDMQKLLKSPWFDQCAGKLAQILFRGPMGSENEGIGSGFAEHGRLPAVIDGLLDREASGIIRAPREEKPRHAEKLMRREELARLWAKRNSAYLRTAGRVD